MRRVFPTIAVLIGLSGAPVLAEPGLTLNFDGVGHAFSVQMDDARTGFTRFLSVDAVSMEGVDGPARLVLELSLPPGARTGDAPHDARISYRPDGWRNYWVSPLVFPEGAVTIHDLDLSSHAPRISGEFNAPLCFTQSPLHAPDPARCKEAHGAFNTSLVQD